MNSNAVNNFEGITRKLVLHNTRLFPRSPQSLTITPLRRMRGCGGGGVVL